MELAKQERLAEEARNREMGTPGDVDFQRMIRNYREKEAPPEQQHQPSEDMKICICVRKRPISQKEIKRKDYDSVTCANPLVVVHDCKLKVDGISKYLDNTPFEFDHTFSEFDNTDDIYLCSVQPLVDFVTSGGRATVFAYGQTGSGKTFTMQGVQKFVAEDLFALIDAMDSPIQVYVSYFEIYGGRCQDLLNNRNRLNVREDGSGEVVVSDMLEVVADSAATLQSIIDTGNRNRTTHATESNDESSRSHAICQIALKHGSTDQLLGRFSLIDLAGSERGADTKSHNRQRRMEGAEINKSLLALKECIRALDSNSTHVPYRASKLTLVLKDSFTNRKSRTVMIATVSPAASSADHTINTLRYADRIKERVVGGQQAKNAAAAAAAAAAGINASPSVQALANNIPQPPRGNGAAGAAPGILTPPPSQDKVGGIAVPQRAEGKAAPVDAGYDHKGVARGNNPADEKRWAREQGTSLTCTYPCQRVFVEKLDVCVYMCAYRCCCLLQRTTMTKQCSSRVTKTKIHRRSAPSTRRCRICSRRKKTCSTCT
jgi:kinesin family protein 2/24